MKTTAPSADALCAVCGVRPSTYAIHRDAPHAGPLAPMCGCVPDSEAWARLSTFVPIVGDRMRHTAMQRLAAALNQVTPESIDLDRNAVVPWLYWLLESWVLGASWSRANPQVTLEQIVRRVADAPGDQIVLAAMGRAHASAHVLLDCAWRGAES